MTKEQISAITKVCEAWEAMRVTREEGYNEISKILSKDINAGEYDEFALVKLDSGNKLYISFDEDENSRNSIALIRVYNNGEYEYEKNITIYM